MRELEPGARERVRELAPDARRKRREIFSYAGSKRSARSVVSIDGAMRFDGSCACGHRAGARAVLRPPLVRAGRALRQLPFVAEQVLEEVVAPLRRRRGPGDFEAAGDGVAALAGAEAALPAEALLFEPGAFGIGADVRRRAPAPWVLPKVWPPAISATVSSSFMAMRREGLADVARRGDRIGIAVRAFRVHVDQAHLHGRERILEIARSPRVDACLSPEPRLCLPEPQ